MFGLDSHGADRRPELPRSTSITSLRSKPLNSILAVGRQIQDVLCLSSTSPTVTCSLVDLVCPEMSVRRIPKELGLSIRSCVYRGETRNQCHSIRHKAFKGFSQELVCLSPVPKKEIKPAITMPSIYHRTVRNRLGSIASEPLSTTSATEASIVERMKTVLA